MNIVAEDSDQPTNEQIDHARTIVDVATNGPSFFIVASRQVGDRIETAWQTACFPTQDLPRAVADLVTTLIASHDVLTLNDFVEAIQKPPTK